MQGMVEVAIDSIRVSLMSTHRVVILKDTESERYLPIWIGPFEADAITVELQEVEVARPLTHDILNNVITELGGKVLRVEISDLRNDIFYATLIIESKGKVLAIDSRSSDALALAVRARVSIYVHEAVMTKGAIVPESDVEAESAEPAEAPEGNERLSAFSDFVDSLNFDDLDKSKKDDEED
jgi:bifunctional DNase/RNase